MEVLKKKDGRGSKAKAHWDAFRAKQRATLPPEEVERLDRRRKSQAKWWASLTSEEFKRQTEKKQERRLARRYKLKMAKAAE